MHKNRLGENALESEGHRLQPCRLRARSLVRFSA